MSGDAPTLVDVLKQRLLLVQEISSAQSRNVLNRQLGGGAEFEIERIEREIAATGASHVLINELKDARERLQRANAEMAACDAQCAALERRLEELDRWIADGR
jgi:cell division septum initiation protein DivIVA